MNISPTQRFDQQAGVLSEQLDDDLLLMDVDNDFLFSLNPVGALIWSALGEGLSFAELIEQLAGEFPEVERELLHDDAAGLLQELLEAKLIVRRDG
jgi:hypothetical protein